MLPHERSLVEHYRKEPFVVLGVNTDPSREALARAQERLQVPWRSWWDGGLRICNDWGAESLPTLYLLDHRGVIRHFGTGAPPPDELDRKIEDLLREARASS
jgi:hypothetical protein